MDNVTGDLSDTRTRYLGVRPVKLFRISMQGSEAVSLLLYIFLYFSSGGTFIISILMILNKTIKQSYIHFLLWNLKKKILRKI